MDINRTNPPELPTDIFLEVASDVAKGDKLWGSDVQKQPLSKDDLFLPKDNTAQHPVEVSEHRVIWTLKPSPNLPSTSHHALPVENKRDPKALRKMKNRDSACKSRIKKKKELQDLHNEIDKLKNENSTLKAENSALKTLLLQNVENSAPDAKISAFKTLLSQTHEELDKSTIKFDEYDAALNELTGIVKEDPLKRSLPACGEVTGSEKYDDTAASGELLHESKIARLERELQNRDKAINKLKAAFHNFEKETS
ncbi:hypothetical protein [Endozoicomonas euniceicola]|uniref:BZIP domain-containing protein n=1 Tax=Endozoicomonas euniceicola TaxID=1234143 RepID=A0ABY6GRI3_9GAMM|nr:hypothetical protein [Endozoicomonas euniceicola]UYM15355.1 hypothetical protein NX720_21260 [Endozoicomonas euniceicola]